MQAPSLSLMKPGDSSNPETANGDSKLAGEWQTIWQNGGESTVLPKEGRVSRRAQALGEPGSGGSEAEAEDWPQASVAF